MQANRDIAEGMLRIAQQERRLAELARSGHDTGQARAILAASKESLQQTINQRKEMLIALGK